MELQYTLQRSKQQRRKRRWKCMIPTPSYITQCTISKTNRKFKNRFALNQQTANSKRQAVSCWEQKYFFISIFRLCT